MERNKLLMLLGAGVVVLAAAGGGVALVVRSSGPHGLLRAYFNQSSCADRARYILAPDANAPRLADYYKNKESCVDDVTKMEDGNGCSDTPVGGYCNVHVFKKSGTSWYCVVRTDDGYKIDWPCSAGWNPVSFAALQAAPPASSVLLRVSAKLDSGNTRQYPEADYYTLALSDGNGGQLQAFVAKGTDDAGKIFDVLKDGQPHPMMLKVLHEKGSWPSQVLVTRFVASNWRQQPEEAGETTPAAHVSSPASAAAVVALPSSTAAPPPATAAAGVGGFATGTIGASPELAACCAALQQQQAAVLVMWCGLRDTASPAGRKAQLHQNAAAANITLPPSCN